MTCEHEGRKYEIRFRHDDRRFIRRPLTDEEKAALPEPKVGGKPKFLVTPLTLKQQKKVGGNQTTVRILDVSHTEGGMPVVVAAATVRHHLKADPFNRHHARWYALERALSTPAFVGEEGLRRKLWKAFYEGTAWRPDGTDGYRIANVKRRKPGLTAVVKRELVPWTSAKGFAKLEGAEVVG